LDILESTSTTVTEAINVFKVSNKYFIERPELNYKIYSTRISLARNDMFLVH